MMATNPMATAPISIVGKPQSTGSGSTRHSVSSSTASRRVSDTSSYGQSTQAESRRRGSRASSKHSICTRDTSISDDLTPHPLASPASSIKSSRQRRPRVISISQTSHSSVRQDVLDPLAFHHRSTQLFPMSPTSTQPLQYLKRPSIQRITTSPEAARPRTATLSRAISQPGGPRLDDQFDSLCQYHQPMASDDSLDETTIEPSAVMHWTSDETRRKEYDDIDRSRKGLRGLWNRVAPKFARSGTCSRFYDENDGSDTGSVRRFRLDLPADEKS